MIAIRRSAERGHADHGWLDAHHTFSFAGYRDPDFMAFGHLCVLNQDRIAAGRGFDAHGHDNMEIVTYVLEGVLEHEDSMGHGSRIHPGDVQLMSAGTGVTHSEFNGSPSEVVELLQMWVLPAERDREPSYGQKSFPDDVRRNALALVVSPDGRDGSLRIGQDARLFIGTLEAEARVTHTLDPRRRAWLHVARGAVNVNGTLLGPGDGAGIQEEEELRLVGVEEADLVLFDLV